MRKLTFVHKLRQACLQSRIFLVRAHARGRGDDRPQHWLWRPRQTEDAVALSVYDTTNLLLNESWRDPRKDPDAAVLAAALPSALPSPRHRFSRYSKTTKLLFCWGTPRLFCSTFVALVLESKLSPMAGVRNKGILKNPPPKYRYFIFQTMRQELINASYRENIAAIAARVRAPHGSMHACAA